MAVDKIKNEELSNLSEKELKDMAETKRKGKPEHAGD